MSSRALLYPEESSEQTVNYTSLPYSISFNFKPTAELYFMDVRKFIGTVKSEAL